ncbi:hypothetical protein GCM10023183_23520 [Nibribacter koreensis]|uniref:Uncharacterized protein n=1 Tax=Nibribacter koreensis TaxID=1084519 RepID=A0ABP8FNF1_9BACT
MPSTLNPGNVALEAGAGAGSAGFGAAGFSGSAAGRTGALFLMSISGSGSWAFLGSGFSSAPAGFFPMFNSAASALACMDEANSLDSILNCSGVIFEVGLFSTSTPFFSRNSTTVEVLMFKVVATCLSLIVLSSDMLNMLLFLFGSVLIT